MSNYVRINAPVRCPDGSLYMVSTRMSREAFDSGAMQQIMNAQLTHFGVTLPEPLPITQLTADGDEYTLAEVAATIQPH